RDRGGVLDAQAAEESDGGTRRPDDHPVPETVPEACWVLGGVGDAAVRQVGQFLPGNSRRRIASRRCAISGESVPPHFWAASRPIFSDSSTIAGAASGVSTYTRRKASSASR